MDLKSKKNNIIIDDEDEEPVNKNTINNNNNNENNQKTEEKEKKTFANSSNEKNNKNKNNNNKNNNENNSNKNERISLIKNLLSNPTKNNSTSAKKDSNSKKSNFKPEKKENFLNIKHERPNPSKTKKKKDDFIVDESSDSEDSEYTEKSNSKEEEEESEEQSEKSKKKEKKKPHKKISNKNPNKNSNKNSNNKNSSNKILKPKASLVYDLLKRWWYSMPKWPPENYDCSEQLRTNKLRVVNVADWKKEPNVDENNFAKCFELPGFKYVFFDCNNKTYDFRPSENKPSFNNLINFPEIKLWEFLKDALFNQINEIKNLNGNSNQTLIQNLQEQFENAQKNFNKLKQ